MGNIGDDKKHIELEPLEVPATEPVPTEAPVKEPEPVPA